MTEKKTQIRKLNNKLQIKNKKPQEPDNNSQDVNNELQDTGDKPQETITADQETLTSLIKETDSGEISSFYARVLEEAEKLDFQTASRAEGLDDEISIMRVKIKMLMEQHPDDVNLLISAFDMLVKMVKTRYSMNKKQDKNLGAAIQNIIRDIGVPLGVTVLNKKL
jgi:hypothetical protein